MKGEPMPDPREGVDGGRRSFLKAAGLAGAGSVAAAGGLAGAAAAQESPEELTQERYRLTPHVERFYFLNRL